ncbi:MAG: hypothetical protein IJ335_04385 [Lachnospiraceae bacterium]|nr:hypothetical protein [Lachnospiraceae bacterium]
MSRAKNKIGFGLFTLGLVLILVLLLGNTAAGRSGQVPEEEQYFVAREQQMATQMREYLGAEGYSNSGINITHMTDADGQRFYTVRIHHQEITLLEEAEKQQLLAALNGVFEASADLKQYSRWVEFF